jgi:hypothetical protein
MVYLHHDTGVVLVNGIRDPPKWLDALVPPELDGNRRPPG